MILDSINKANDIKNIDPNKFPELSEEIREFMIEKISKSGGHIASSLGAVELTMALHRVLDFPKDKLIWDVGHQAYAHKILTGRKDGFDRIRTYGGISGFPNPSESDCDAFISGHSSNSISAGLGMAVARDKSGENYRVVSVIGDGALTGGMAYEALNNARIVRGNFIIVLNDNNMAISENVGNVSRMMTSLRTDPKYIKIKKKVAGRIERIPRIGDDIMYRLRGAKSSLKQLIMPSMFFEDLGLKYLGPVDGHDVKEMISVFEDAKRVRGPVVVHVMTEKGHGYQPAVNNPEKFHGIGKFDPKTGETIGTKNPDYSAVFGKMMCKLSDEDDKIVCISAAMPEGVGLKEFSKTRKGKFYDVGIAEGHAVTFAAGLAKGGLKPYVCIYSTFLQRAYDQIVHDVCLQNLPVTFIVDRAGIVGADGETHQGLLDISYLSSVPNMTVFAPKNAAELISALRFSTSYDKPLAIRFPRGEALRKLEEYDEPIEYGKAEMLTRGQMISIVAAGNMVETAMKVRDMYLKEGISITVVNARFLRPFDEKTIEDLSSSHKLIFTLEDGTLSGGFGEHVAEFAIRKGLKTRVIPIAIPDKFVPHGAPEVLKEAYGLDAGSIYNTIKRYMA